jgi:glycerol-3-phosphate dehydrogenase
MRLPGLGDLVTTSSGGRNGSFGRMLGQGKSVNDALDELEEQGVGVIEGYETASLGLQLAEEASVDMDDLPLLRETSRVLYEDKSVVDALDEINF